MIHHRIKPPPLFYFFILDPREKKQLLGKVAQKYLYHRIIFCVLCNLPYNFEYFFSLLLFFKKGKVGKYGSYIP